jgi:membrane protein
MKEKFIEKAKKVSFPGFKGIPIYNIFSLFIKETKNDSITMRAAAISFNFLLAIFPTSIFLLTLIPYFPIDNLDESLINFFKQMIPNAIYHEIEALLLDILQKPQKGLLSINFVLALYFSTNGVMSIMKAFDKVNHNFKKRNFLEKFWNALCINSLIVFQIIIIAAFLLLSIDKLNLFFHNLGFDFSLVQIKWLNKLLKALIVFATFFNTIALIYFFGPSVRKRYHYFSVGAMFASVLAIISSYLFAVYLKFFIAEINSLYGSLSVMIVLMIWININSLVLIFGFELNNSISLNKTLIQKSEKE